VIDYRTHDKKYGMPSFLNTLFVLTAILLNPPTVIILSISGLLALILYEMDFFQGLADLKILAALLILLGNIYLILIYIVALIIITIITAYIIKRKTDFPYIITLTITYYIIITANYLIHLI
jgi:hypothetical protein